MPPAAGEAIDHEHARVFAAQEPEQTKQNKNPCKTSRKQEEELEEFINENGAYALEDEGDWYLSDTECWVWGPLELEDEEGNVRIIIADEDGNVVDFEEE